MSGSFSISSGVMTITKDGRVVFSTDRPLMNLVPSAAITITHHAIVFPDLRKGTIYHKYRHTPNIGGVPIGPDESACASFAGIIEQEWGPLESSPFTLADEVLGTVPAGTDYLDVMVNLTNTTVSAGWYDLDRFSMLPPGEWVKLEGGSCLVEYIPGMRRLFEIVLDGTNVVLRRYQSVTANGAILRTGGFGLGNQTGYVAGTNAPTDGSKYAIYGALIQTKGPSAGSSDASWAPGGENGCSTTPPSYASTWTGDFLITPGRISA